MEDKNEEMQRALAAIDKEEEAELQAVRKKFEKKRQGVSSGTSSSSSKREDWTCPACGDFQFARNDACRKCRTPRPGTTSTSTTTRASTTTTSRGRQGQDWICFRCGDRQFARNVACRTCKVPKTTMEDYLKRLEADRVRKETEERRKQEEEDRNAKEIGATMNRENSADCWAARWVIPYFEGLVRVSGGSGHAPHSLSVTNEDDDWAALKDTPINEDGHRLVYDPDAPLESERYKVYKWHQYGESRRETQIHSWSEGEMLYRLSYGRYHSIFADNRYHNSLAPWGKELL